MSDLYRLKEPPAEGSGMDLVVVDGPNLFNRVGELLAEEAAGSDAPFLSRYLSDFFDVDRLVAASIGCPPAMRLGLVIFHSAKALGRGTWRLSDSDAFWTRQGLAPECSSLLVSIPGAPTGEGEKGVDTAITSYLYETEQQWDSCCIVSDDADYVPPVLALRRRGRRVFALVSGKRDDPALARAAQSAYGLNVDFLRADFRMARLIMKDGDLDRLCNLQIAGASGPPRFTNYASTRGPHPLRSGQNLTGPPLSADLANMTSIIAIELDYVGATDIGTTLCSAIREHVRLAKDPLPSLRLLDEKDTTGGGHGTRDRRVARVLLEAEGIVTESFRRRRSQLMESTHWLRGARP